MAAPSPTPVDVVVVSYNSRATLRDCVVPLAAAPGARVVVVDNASPEDPLDTIADVDVTTIRAPRNGGFSYGCNIGIAAGEAPYVLLLNPDARLTAGGLDALRAVLDADPDAGLVGPRLLEDDGSTAPSLRRFPRLRSDVAQALFLHRTVSGWDELIHDPEAYAAPHAADWVSGACMLIRRTALERVGPMDERFFLYCEDTDICRRMWDAGFSVRYTPDAVAGHVGGASGDRSGLRSVLTASRVAYARKHGSPLGARAQTVAIGIGEGLHALAKLRRPAARRGHLAAARTAFTGAPGAS